MKSPQRPAVLSIALLCFSLASSTQAQEKRFRLGLTGGYSSLATVGTPADGFGATVLSTYGINDAINLRVEGELHQFALPGLGNSITMLGGSLGAEYLLDVLDWIPYAGLVAGISYSSLRYGSATGQLAATLPFGLGYRLSPQWSVAVEGRYTLFFGGYAAAAETVVTPTSRLSAHARLAYTFGSP